MTFWEHLDELRGVLFRSIVAVAVLMVVAFFNKDFIFDKIVFAPRASDFILYRWLNALHLPGLHIEPFTIKLQNIELASQFFTHMNVSMSLGFVVAMPYIIFQLWTFIKPALYPNEKKSVTAAFGWCSILFFMGVAVGYLFVFPLTLNFLGNYQVTDYVENQISLKSYIHMFTWLILIMGLVFEMPVLARVLSRLGVITRDLLRKHRKHAFVILLLLAAIITPSGDAFTLFIVQMPLYLLYEVSIFVCHDLPE